MISASCVDAERAPAVLKERQRKHPIFHRLSRLSLSLLAFLIAFIHSPLRAANIPPAFREKQVASGLAKPTAMEIAPDGRLFVCEQAGTVRVITSKGLLPAPFLSLTVDSTGERGLLDIAFDPDFTTNQYVYVSYTATTPTVHNRVSRFVANGDTVAPNSEVVLLDLDTLGSATDRNGGAIHFGADGKLYIAVGDNGNGSNAPLLTNRFGKILRINADGTIPSDNPFTNTATGLNRAIWAIGFHNPSTLAVQPGTGNLFINDRGQSTFEEINRGIAGANYGWPDVEGPSSNPAFANPIFFYKHGVGETKGNAIHGGAFYNPMTLQFPNAYLGNYFFADAANGWIRSLPPGGASAQTFATGLVSPVDLKVADNGSLYYLAQGSGANTGVVGQIKYTATVSGIVILQDCVDSVQPIHFMFRPKNGSPEFTRTQTLAADGSFTIENLPPGAYNIAVKGAKWLQTVQATDVTLVDVTNFAVPLRAGDMTGDNLVDFDDLTLLAIAYNSTPADDFWIPEADLNCDGIVDFEDLFLVATNYNTEGDP